MPDNLCLITLGSVIMQIKLASFLRLIVSSCIAELDLFKLTCKTLIFFCSRDSGRTQDESDVTLVFFVDETIAVAMFVCRMRLTIVIVGALLPLSFETVVVLYSGMRVSTMVAAMVVVWAAGILPVGCWFVVFGML